VRALTGQPLRRQILVATAALLLVLTAAVVWSSGRSRVERREEVRDEAASVATLAAAYLNQYFNGLDAMASTLLRHPAITSLDHAGSSELLTELLREQPLLLNVVLRDGKLGLVAAGLQGTPSQPSAPLPPYLADVLATGRPGVGEINVGPITGRPTLGQAYPVRTRQGALVGVLSFGLDLLQLARVFEGLSLPDGSVVALVDSKGRVLARSREGARYVGKSIPSRSAGGSDALEGLELDVDGVERFVGSVPVTRGSWSLRVGIPKSVVLARLAPLWWRNLTISLITVGAVFLSALWLSSSLSRSLNRLRVLAGRIANGDLSPPELLDMPNLEIAELQHGLIAMAANLRQAKAALDDQVEHERRMRETLQSLQRQLVRQERLAAVGLLVSGVAHELNNPLQAILGTAELVERHPSIPSDLQEEIALLKSQSGRAREIIRNLARFGNQHPGLPSLLDLRAVISEVIQLRRHPLDEAGIALEIDASASQKVYANVTELEQVTLNFVINAQQAIQSTGRRDGRILIRLLDEDDSVRLEVADNGPGVAPDDEPKLFQPFFTTKPVGQGTGLGLSVSYGIVESYGGTIGCRRNQWDGATFFFVLPSAGAAVEAPLMMDDRASRSPAIALLALSGEAQLVAPRLRR
jgi:C4-dicarboxylate-specific signal transduction histidine kinase